MKSPIVNLIIKITSRRPFLINFESLSNKTLWKSVKLLLINKRETNI